MVYICVCMCVYIYIYIYYVYVCEQAHWARSAGNSGTENVCIVIITVVLSLIFHDDTFFLFIYIKIIYLFILGSTGDNIHDPWKWPQADLLPSTWERQRNCVHNGAAYCRVVQDNGPSEVLRQHQALRAVPDHLHHPYSRLCLPLLATLVSNTP